MSYVRIDKYFLFGPRSVEGAFGDYFSSKNLLGFQVGHFVTLGKTTSPECLASGILLYDDFAICLSHFLFYDDCIASGLVLGV